VPVPANIVVALIEIFVVRIARVVGQTIRIFIATLYTTSPDACSAATSPCDALVIVVARVAVETLLARSFMAVVVLVVARAFFGACARIALAAIVALPWGGPGIGCPGGIS